MEHLIQRQFLALAAEQNFRLFGGDAKYDFAHSPAPEVPTFMIINNQYYGWYYHQFNIKLNKSRVLLKYTVAEYMIRSMSYYDNRQRRYN